MHTQFLRLFVSITPGPAFVPTFSAIQTELQFLPDARQIHWTKPDHIHLTLRFLGNIAADQTAPLIRQLQFACQDFRPFVLEIGGLGCFPSAHRPRVLWLGLEGAVDRLAVLQSTIDRELSDFGRHQSDKIFRAHLTIGRLRPGLPPPGPDLCRHQISHKLPPWQVRTVLLMRSELNPAGAQHTLLAAVPLTDAAEA